MSYYYRPLKAGAVATKAELDDREELSAPKTASQSVNNSTTLVTDNHLTLAVAANAIYHVSVMLVVSGPSGADWKQAWTFPSGTTGTQFIHGPELPVASVRSAAIQARSAALSTTLSYGTDGSENSAINEELWVATGGTSGSLALTWAQQAATVGSTTVRFGSWMTAYRVV